MYVIITKILGASNKIVMLLLQKISKLIIIVKQLKFIHTSFNKGC
ncbi:hypothetical protein SEVCU139_1581 [Staphylococcus lugdunensis VCU139]|uniref:Uncharacterized protein n=1 Tax=Staphylococcus lugdunensis TaxID=28035 RepID=A0ABD4EGA7_STALU|nr:hypothetical protein SEVCU139_1581 [Staphylococcus lugdunensis VCU139]KXA38090.1 hypothetical protein HMPREF3225_01346 [Staphylococcus lugdunensis]